MCEVCGINRSVEVGHCLYHKHGKKVAEMKIYDSIENCQSNCHQCNMGAANSRAVKKAHWAKRVAEGYNMDEWNEKIPKYRREGFD